MSNEMLDPRVFFAAERTHLAWLRTGLAIMAIGFMIARFGLFLRLMGMQAGNTEHLPADSLSGPLGILFVGLGTGAMLVSSVQFRRFIRSLPQGQYPKEYPAGFATGFGALMSVLGAALIAYLALSSH